MDEEELERQGKAVVYIAANRVLLGYVAVVDLVRPDAAKAVAWLKASTSHTTQLSKRSLTALSSCVG
jgi:cation transport ATPase